MRADPDQVELFRWADDLPPALWDDLAARSPQVAAQCTEAELEGGVFCLPLLGRSYVVDPTARKVALASDPLRRVSFQAGLVLVSALAHSDGAHPSGRMAAPRELPGGEAFFQGPHAIATEPLEERFGRDLAGLDARARALGGEPVGGADTAWRIPALSLLPMYVLMWAADDEFEARAVVALDDRAPHHLALDGVWALTNVFVATLVRGGG